MKRQILQILTFLVMVMVFTACTPRPITKAGTTPVSLPVPDSLQTIESAAEDIIDQAPNDNWDKIQADIANIVDAWKMYQPQASKDGVQQDLQDALSSALTRLQTTSATKDPLQTMQAANDLSAAVIELFAVYHPVVPVDIGRLDVWERQVILDITAKHEEAASASLTKVKSIWERLKPSILEHHGNDVAAQFDTSIATQEQALAAKDYSKLTSEAQNGLELVDALESLY